MKWDNILKLAAIVIAVAFVSILAVKPVFGDVSWLPFTRLIKQGLDLKGGVHVVLEAVDTPESPVTPDAVKKAMAIVENRVNAFGVAEPVIQQQGPRRIIVELAGIKNPDEAVQNLIRTAYLEFKTEDGATIITGGQLKDAMEAREPGGEIVVNLEFTADGAKKFAEATAANVGRHIGIYIDNQLKTNPVVREPIPNGRAQISGGYETLEDAHNIAILLRSGALPVKLEVLEKRTVGPTLGADSLDRSIKAGAVGLVAILAFMVLYYRIPGLVADLALVIYALLLLMLFAAVHVTMTLPGIAGFLLSLGMAVDANVIIFERLKEELHAGKSLRSAIDAGFKRAFVAIFDSNVTTLIAAAVLYYFGTGPIRGFAVTLSMGILVSMFTAIVMTRQLLHLVAGSNLVRNLKLYGV